MSDEGKRPPAHDAEALDDYVDRLERSLRINMDAYNRALRKARDKRRKRKAALNPPAEDEVPPRPTEAEMPDLPILDLDDFSADEERLYCSVCGERREPSERDHVCRKGGRSIPADEERHKDG